MAKMVEALAPLQQRIFSLNFFRVAVLMHKAQAMQESGSKICFLCELEPVFELLSLESWAGLLDEVADQYENNAGKMNEPILDLLEFLTYKLDSAVAKARLPSGHNPLEQLVLFISDGQFHEQDNLKWIGDLSTMNRMVAFLVLDNSQESIMDRTEVKFDRNGKMKLSKYMESFPFPYYVVLRNIEALPRTLADLLRKWMELVQKSVG